jgi:hypothetical protein
MDVNRQTWASSTSLLVHPAELYVASRDLNSWLLESMASQHFGRQNLVVADEPSALLDARDVPSILAEPATKDVSLNWLVDGWPEDVVRGVGSFREHAEGLDIQHVPYRGAGPAMQDLIAGHVPVVFDGLGSSAAPVRAGQLRALAVAAPKRVPAFPDLPTAAEAGLAGYEVSTWYGLFAPKGTPPEIIAKLNAAARTANCLPALDPR